MRSKISAMLAATAALALSACGGGSGGSAVGVQSTPVPPQAPTPAPTPAPAPVTIFASPTAGQYSSVGASIAGPGGNLDTYQSATLQFGTVSTAPTDQAQVRYTADGYYEVKLAGADWSRLVHYGALQDPTANNNYFQPSNVPTNQGYLLTRNARQMGYSYSEMAWWGSEAQGRWGYTAFGTATPPGGVPTSGSAMYSGIVQGSSDVLQADNFYGGYFTQPTDGDVVLNFDFATGSLNGFMNLYLPDSWDTPLYIGQFKFSETVFSPGNTNYSGRFNSAAAGQNFFFGQFTGPNAQETIGAWAVPFLFNQKGAYLQGDGQVHQAFGAWIAKRAN